MKKYLCFVLLFLSLFLLIGCGEEETSTKPTGIVITGTKTVNVGNYVDLKANVSPKEASQKVSWSSNDENVAEVSDKGRVTGKNVGSATITATSQEDTKIKGTIIITVVEAGVEIPDEVIVTAINLGLEEEVYADFDFRLTVTTEPENQNSRIVWSSSDEEIATVSKGIIHGVKEGSCDIIAKVGDFEQKLTITVHSRPDLESFVITNLHDIDTNGVDQLGVETTPKYAKVDITWTIDNPAVATIDETGLLKPIKDGSVNVTAQDKATGLTQSGTVVITKAFNPDEVEPSSVSISGESECYVGYKIRFSAEVLPAGVSQEVTWSVTPEGYATIDENGVLTAIKEGTIRVKATSVAGTKKVTSTAFKVTIEKMVEPEPIPNLGGYEIVIMNAQSALSDIDPFLEKYSGIDKSYKQTAWREIESSFNCKISVKAYPEEAPWGPSRVNWIKEQAMNNLSQCDFGIIAAAWLSDFVKSNAAVNTTEFFNAFGKKQIEPSLREAGMINNRLYVVSPGLPETKVYPYKGLFYNMMMIKKYNLESPAKLFNEDKWTYEDFVEYCKQAQSVMGETDKGKEYVMSGASSIIWNGMVNAAGVKLADKTTISLNFTHTYSLDAARALREIYEAGAWDPDNMTSVDESVTSFQEGRALFQGGEYWFVRASNRFPADKWGPETAYGYVPFPYPASVGKANTRVNDIGDSLMMMIAGRPYPAGIEARNVFRAVQEMFINTSDALKQDPAYNAEELKYNSVVSRIDDPESVIATIYFTASRTIYDPLYEQSFQYEWTGESATAIKNIVVEGKDPAQEFESIEDAVLSKFRQTYS